MRVDSNCKQNLLHLIKMQFEVPKMLSCKIWGNNFCIKFSYKKLGILKPFQGYLNCIIHMPKYFDIECKSLWMCHQ